MAGYISKGGKNATARKSIHKAGKKASRRYGKCSRCLNWFQPGDWVKGAPGRGPVWQHAYDCPTRTGLTITNSLDPRGRR